MQDKDLPNVSIIVIGRNESNNLPSTFDAIRQMEYPNHKLEVIYVDTSSTDDSVEIANNNTDKVFVEKNKWPTSGLARNRGLLEASNEIVHFVDGDIAITKDYLKHAVEKILQPGVDAVTGYFVEKRPDKFFNRIMDIRRDGINHQERFCESTNGGGTYLKSKLLQVNGYDERILKGQESELGIRFREKGFQILFIDQIQGVHNFDINSIFDFIKFKFNYGKSSGYLLKTKVDVNDFIKAIKKTAKKILFTNLLALLTIILALFTGLFLIPVIYYFLRISSLIVTVKIRHKKSNRFLLHNLIQYLFMFSTFFGIVKVSLDRGLIPGPKGLLN